MERIIVFLIVGVIYVIYQIMKSQKKISYSKTQKSDFPRKKKSSGFDDIFKKIEEAFLGGSQVTSSTSTQSKNIGSSKQVAKAKDSSITSTRVKDRVTDTIQETRFEAYNIQEEEYLKDDLVNMLHNESDIKKAFLLKEILERPNF